MAHDESAMDTMAIEIVYALPQRQVLLTLAVRQGTTVREAVELSGLPAAYPGIDLAHGKFGIFGKRAAVDTALKNGDRIECYRPLTADPKEARRRRARKAK